MGSRLDNNSSAVRKRIEEHAFSDETGEEYGQSAFGGFSDYFRRKKIKLQNLDADIRASSSGKPQIFKGIVAHVTGYTQPPLHVLHRDLVEHGAGFLQYLDSKTMATHIIASSLPPKKAVEFSKYRIVKPSWVTESIKAGRLLPWSDFRVIEETPRQKTLRFDGSSLGTQSSTRASPISKYREQTANSFYTGQFKGLEDADASSSSTQLNMHTPTPPTANLADSDTLSRGSPMDIKTPSKQVDPSLNVSRDLLQMETEEESIKDAITPDFRTDARPDLVTGGASTTSDPKAKPSKDLTSEEHNALLLQDPRMRKSSTANPDFIKQFYSESRLHHLSTWKAELKSRMQKLAAEKGSRPKPAKRKPGMRSYILHVDFDSFFCAVSLKSSPEFIDKPTVVAHGNGNGSEIASCNYPAREYGVKNGMWMKRAKELCPDLKVLPYDFPAYEDASRSFYECILDVGGVVQSVSIDEALVDATAVILSAAGTTGAGIDEGSIWREQEQADRIALALREQIKLRTDCAVSVGIGGNILLAKVALRKAKPAGQYQIKPEEILDILGPLKVDSLPGVAHSIAGKLEEIGVKFVEDIRQTSKERLIGNLGPKTGEKLWEYARGIDRTEVGEQPIRKSVSAEVNWGIRFINQEEAEEFIFNLCKELERRLLNEQVKGKQLTMKIMRRSLDAPLDPAKHLGHGKCDTFSKSVMFGVSSHNSQVLGKEAVAILRSYKFSPGDLRGLGVQLTKLEPIKSSALGPDGSQKRLSFGAFRSGPASAKKTAASDPIHEAELLELREADSPTSSKKRRDMSEDPISEGPVTPRKARPSQAAHPALALSKANAKDSKANTPLNVAGTQFIMPTNPDPAVLAELPQDIRTKLMAQGRNSSSSSRDVTPAGDSRTASPAPRTDEIPSDIDREVFNALPDDMKAEILASYQQPARGRQMMTLAHSPRKDRVAQPPRKPTTPTKRRGRPPGVSNLFARARERQADASSKIVQTNLVPADRRVRRETPTNNGDGFQDDDVVLPEELDASFLAELPEEMRQEILEDHLRRRRRGAADVGPDLLKIMNPKKQQQAAAAAAAVTTEDYSISGLSEASTKQQQQQQQQQWSFPPRPKPIPFTSAGLTTLPEIRDMLRVWHASTSTSTSASSNPTTSTTSSSAPPTPHINDGKKKKTNAGPHARDAAMLVRYLGRVVTEEKDMAKAVGVVKWVEWLVENGNGDDDDDNKPNSSKQAWRGVVGQIKEEVQRAVRARGLGELHDL